jgi:hypothetical protein
MSKGKKTGGRNFVKGQVANPKGRPALTEEQKAIQALTREQFLEVANLLITKSIKELKEIEESPDTPALNSWIIRVILHNANVGDYDPLDKLLNRLIGKVPDKVESENNHYFNMLKEAQALTDDQLIHLSDQAKDFLKGGK